MLTTTVFELVFIKFSQTIQKKLKIFRSNLLQIVQNSILHFKLRNLKIAAKVFFIYFRLFDVLFELIFIKFFLQYSLADIKLNQSQFEDEIPEQNPACLPKSNKVAKDKKKKSIVKEENDEETELLGQDEEKEKLLGQDEEKEKLLGQDEEKEKLLGQERERLSEQEEEEASENSFESESDIDSQDIDDMINSENEEVSECKNTKKIILDEQEQKTLEKIVKEYGVNNVCFECIVGFSCKKSYAQHMETQHFQDSIEQGLGNFACKYCYLVLVSKNRLLKHIRVFHQSKESKKKGQLTLREQRFVRSYTSQSDKKKKFLKQLIQKKK